MRESMLSTTGDIHARLRVLFLSWRDIKHPEAGGAEIFLEQVSAGLAARGHRITVATARYPGSVAMEARDDRIFFRHGGRLGVYPRGFLHALTRQRHYDAIVDIQNGVPFWAPLTGPTPVLNLVHHVHREQWASTMGPWQSKVGWWLESKASPKVYRRARYLAVSESTRAELVELGVPADRIHIVYSGVEELPQPRAVDDSTADSQRPHLVSLGRLVPHKRVEQAIDAVARLQLQFPEAHLTIAGQGYWEPRLRAHAHMVGVSDRVRFAGVVSEQEKSDLLADADLHLLPSVKEGWGLVIIESGMLGTPTVAYRSAGGTNESIVHGETGLLSDDEDDFHFNIRRLLVQSEERNAMGINAKKFADSFSWDRSVSEVEAALYATANLKR